MSWNRTSLVSLLIGVSALLVGTAVMQILQSPVVAVPPVSTKPAPATAGDAAARKTFDEAVEALDRKHLSWVETTLWQQMEMQGLLFQAEGLYLAGPKDQLHLNLKVQLGDTTGRMEVVCDGTTFWEAMQLGEGERKVTRKVELKQVVEALAGLDIAKQVRDEFFRNQTFTGVLPLMRNLQQQLTFTKKEEDVLWHGRRTIKLTGTWNEAITKGITAEGSGNVWPQFLPRRCDIYLDTQTKWPYRIEWWGPVLDPKVDARILQMEFRNPKLNIEMSSERCARVFKFDPGKGSIPDKTGETIQLLKNSSKQWQQPKMNR